MADRRAELERKKQKLAAMREEKERRRKENEAKKAEEVLGNSTKLKIERVDPDELLNSLGITSISEPSSLKQESAPSRDRSLSPDTSLNSAVASLTRSLRKSQLSVVNVHQTNIPPKEKVTYNKQTQTAGKNDDREVLTYGDVPVDEEGDGLPSLDAGGQIFPGAPATKIQGLPHVEMVPPAQTTEPGMTVEIKEEKKVRELSEEEKMHITMTKEFHTFLDRATRVLERALYEDIDICLDYTGGGEEQDSEDKSGIKVTLNRYFFDDHWSKNRTVTSFDWSTQFPELLVASYNNNEDSPHDPDGVCLVWNMKFKKTTPEYVFHCQSPVMSTCFAKFHPNLIIGGTYSGQIVLWDNRSNKRTPVQRSPLSAVAHTHPIYCVQVVGTQNAHNLISISTDGKFCTWSLDMLSTPQDTMELSQQKQSRAVAVTSLSFPPGDFNNFIVGSEEGNVYTACRHGTRTGIMDSFEGHQGPVTGIDCQGAQQGPVDFSHLFLTSSIDWTVKLWSMKENKPLYSFEDNGDYVYDARWSPVHPSLFACVDGMGRLDLWNLNNDTELPTVSTVVDGAPALNRVIWTPSGHQVAVGDDMGKIWVYDVGEQLASPRSDEWTKFVQTLQELKNNQADQDLDIMSSFNLASTPLR